MASLNQLRKQRDSLLKKDLVFKSRQTQILEKRKLEAEIRALRNPGSNDARKKLFSAIKKTGKFILKRSEIINRNLNQLAEEEEREKRMKKRSKPISKKIKIKKRGRK